MNRYLSLSTSKTSSLKRIRFQILFNETYFISISDPKIDTNNPIFSSFSAMAAQSLAKRKNVSTRPFAGTMKITLSCLVLEESISCRSWTVGFPNISWTRLYLVISGYSLTLIVRFLNVSSARKFKHLYNRSCSYK